MSNNKDFKVKNGIQPTVYHEGLGTVVSGSEGYSLSAASYDSKSGATNSNGTNDFTFNDDGTKIFGIRGYFNDDEVSEYPLSTAYDISSIGSATTSFNINSQSSDPSGVAFSANGLKMFVSGYGTPLSANGVFEYALSTAFDLSTASYNSVSYSTGLSSYGTTGLRFSSDGLSFYIADASDYKIYQFSLSTAFDLSTASNPSKSLLLSSETTLPQGFSFNSDGTKLFVIEDASVVYMYNLSTAWDVTTGSYSGTSFSVASQGNAGRSIAFNPSGSKMFTMLTTSHNIYQYSTALNTAELDLSTGSVFDYTPTSDVQVTLSNPAASGTVSGATLLLEGAGAGYAVDGGSYDEVSFSTASQGTSGYGFFFKPDGTKFYTTDFSNNAVYQYDLSTAWDITTATYSSNSLSVTQAIELHFRSDGLRLMVIDDGDTVKQYTLSTAWDLSTASYDNKSFSVSGQDTSVYSFFFKDDGTKMYIGGNINDSVFQYTLSTAWDISTASYDSVSFSVAATLAGAPTAMYFKPDGTSMFLTRNSTKLIEYPLSTAWDLSTASYTGVFYESFATSIGGGSNPEVYGLSFKDDGTKFYVFASGSASLNSVYQFSSVAGYTITYDPTLEWPGGTAPTAPAIGETDVVTFNTRDGGSTYQGVLAIDGAK